MTREEVFEYVKGILVETLSVDEDKVTVEARFQEDPRPTLSTWSSSS